MCSGLTLFVWQTSKDPEVPYKHAYYCNSPLPLSLSLSISLSNWSINVTEPSSQANPSQVNPSRAGPGHGQGRARPDWAKPGGQTKAKQGQAKGRPGQCLARLALVLGAGGLPFDLPCALLVRAVADCAVVDFHLAAGGNHRRVGVAVGPCGGDGDRRTRGL